LKPFRFILSPFALLLGIILRIRHALFNLGVWKSTTPQIRSIGIGNLSAGGTGKTPLTIFLSQLFRDLNPVVISRGYGRKSKGLHEVVSGGEAEQFGDEPLEIKHNSGAQVIVCEKRVKALQHLKDTSSDAKLIVFDDVLQHRWVKPHFNLLLTTFGQPFFEDHLFPWGMLRDLKSRAKAADLILVTKSVFPIENSTAIRYRNSIQQYSSAPVFFTGLAHRFENTQGELLKNPNSDCSHLIITGIAKPEKLNEYLGSKGISGSFHRFSDHHNFKDEELKAILSKFLKFASESSTLITTRKDWTRLSAKQKALFQSKLQVVIVAIELIFESDQHQNDFQQLVHQGIIE